MNTKVAEDGFMIIRSASFVPNFFRPLSEPTPAMSQPVTPTCSPCDEVIGGNLQDGDPLAVLLAAADQIGWLGRDTLSAILSTMQGEAKTKATTHEAELAQKETENNKASSNERFDEKKVQASTEAVARFRKVLGAEEERLARLGPVWVQAKKRRATVSGGLACCALCCAEERRLCSGHILRLHILSAPPNLERLVVYHSPVERNGVNFVSENLTCYTGIARERLRKLSQVGAHVTNAGIIAGRLECFAL